MSKKKKRREAPEWVSRGRKAAVIYDILAAPFAGSCDCETCRIIRENIEFLGSIFKPPRMPGEDRER